MALLRGIGPLNPNMRNENLRAVVEGLGFDNVRTVITTGNVIFDSPSAAIREFESRIEKAWPRELGFKSTTIIRSKKQMRDLVDSDVLKALVRAHEADVDVTFLKRKPRGALPVPYQPEDGRFNVVALDERTLASTVDPSSKKPPDYMRWIEKRFGKDVTTRTYRTVERILKKLNEG